MHATVSTEAKAILNLVRGAGPRVHAAFKEGAAKLLGEQCQIIITGEAQKVVAFMQIFGMLPNQPPAVPQAVAQMPEGSALH